MFYLKIGYAGGMGATTIDNFTSKAACEAAGQAFVVKNDVYQLNETHTTGLIHKTQNTTTENFYPNVIAKSYQCVEVK
jgi:molybdopterin-biosynthesis enzyme MoeA-like protein